MVVTRSFKATEGASAYADRLCTFVRMRRRPETQIEIVTPIIHLKKHEIVRRGIELGAPLHLTWSCYQNEEEACGTCGSCALRRRAFAQAGVEDPIAYRVRLSYTGTGGGK